MPNRILREGILSSERIDRLSSWASEVFYRRLMSVVDDFGRYFAKPELLRAGCYPLKLDKVSNADVGKWLTDCVNAALVSTYEVDGKAYLQLQDFRQQVRAKESRFPPPPDECAADAQQTPSKDIASAHLGGGVVGVVSEGEGAGAKVSALAAICLRNRVNAEGAKGLLHMRQWVTDGITEQELADAILIARDRKPDPEIIPIAYIATILPDLRAGRVRARPASQADVIAVAMANIAAKEGNAPH